MFKYENKNDPMKDLNNIFRDINALLNEKYPGYDITYHGSSGRGANLSLSPDWETMKPYIDSEKFDGFIDPYMMFLERVERHADQKATLKFWAYFKMKRSEYGLAATNTAPYIQDCGTFGSAKAQLSWIFTTLERSHAYCERVHEFLKSVMNDWDEYDKNN